MIGKLALKTKKIRELANLKLKDVSLEFFYKQIRVKSLIIT